MTRLQRILARKQARTVPIEAPELRWYRIWTQATLGMMPGGLHRMLPVWAGGGEIGFCDFLALEECVQPLERSRSPWCRAMRRSGN